MGDSGGIASNFDLFRLKVVDEGWGRRTLVLDRGPLAPDLPIADCTPGYHSAHPFHSAADTMTETSAQLLGQLSTGALFVVLFRHERDPEGVTATSTEVFTLMAALGAGPFQSASELPEATELRVLDTFPRPARADAGSP